MIFTLLVGIIFLGSQNLQAAAGSESSPGIGASEPWSVHERVRTPLEPVNRILTAEEVSDLRKFQKLSGLRSDLLDALREVSGAMHSASDQDVLSEEGRVVVDRINELVNRHGKYVQLKQGWQNPNFNEDERRRVFAEAQSCHKFLGDEVVGWSSEGFEGCAIIQSARGLLPLATRKDALHRLLSLTQYGYEQLCTTRVTDCKTEEACGAKLLAREPLRTRNESRD